MDQLIERFRHSHKERGEYDLKSQIPFLTELADIYFKRYQETGDWRDCLKAHGLLNSVKVRDTDENSEHWDSKIFSVQKAFFGDVTKLNKEGNILLTTKTKDKLTEIRSATKELLKESTNIGFEFDSYPIPFENKKLPLLLQSIENVSMTCTQAMVGLLNQIISDSIQIIGQDLPCAFEAVAIGSLARGDATPYSDAEFMFLIERNTPETVVYFERLAVVSYFLINNIGETKLSHLAIPELHGWFQDRCDNGFQIAGLDSNACNIPTGTGEETSNFIVTPLALAAKYGDVYSHSDNVRALRGDLIYELAYTRSIGCYGSVRDEGLLAEFQRLIRENENCLITDNINFRFPSLDVTNLSILYQSHDQSIWESMRSLCTKGKISKSVKQSLLIQNACPCFVRLSAYLHHNSHDDRIYVARCMDSVRSECADKSTRRWFVPLDLVVLELIYTKSLKDHLYKAGNVSDLMTALKNNALFSMSWLTHMEVLYQCGRFADAYAKIVENVDLKLLENRPTDLIERLHKAASNPSDAIKSVCDVLIAVGQIAKSIDMCHESLITFLDQNQSEYYSPIVTDMLGVYGRCLKMMDKQSATQQRYPDAQDNVLRLAIIFHDCWVSKNRGDSRISTMDRHLQEILECIKRRATDEMFFVVFESIANSCINECSAPRQALLFIDVMVSEVQVHDQKAYSLFLKGCAYHELKQYELAIGSFSQSLTFYTKLERKQDMANLHKRIAKSYRDNIMYTEAEASEYQCLKLNYSIHGEGVSHIESLRALILCGDVSRLMKKYKQGEAALLKSRAMCEKLIGWSTSSFEKYDIMWCTGKLYFDMGVDYNNSSSLYKKSKEAHEVALATVRDLYGSECRQQIPILHELGIVHNNLGDSKQGKAFLIYALNLMQCDYNIMPLTLLNIGIACIRLGELDNAERYLNEAQMKFTELYPDQSSHHYLALIINGTAQLKMKRHNVSGSISDYKKSLAMLHSIYTSEKLNVWFDLNLRGLAEAYEAQHKQKLKYQCCLERLAYYLRMVGVDFSHAVVRSILDCDMTIKMSQYNCTSASDPLLKMTIALHEIWRKDIIYLTGASLEDCEKSLLLLLDSSSFSKARPYASSINGTEALSLLRTIGRDCRSTGSSKRAAAYFSRVLSLHEELHGAECSGEDIADVVEWLGDSYCDLGEYQKSSNVYERWLTRYMGEQLILPSNPLGKTIVDVLLRLGKVYAKLDMWDKCLTCFHRSLEVALTYHEHQTSHFKVLHTLDNLRDIYCLWLEQHEIVEQAEDKYIIQMFVKTEDQSTRLAIGYFQLASIRSKNKKYDIAQGFYKHALTWLNEIHPVDNSLHTEILNVLGMTHLKTDNLSGAISLFRQSLSIHHGHSSRAKGLYSAVSYLRSQ